MTWGTLTSHQSLHVGNNLWSYLRLETQGGYENPVGDLYQGPISWYKVKKQESHSSIDVWITNIECKIQVDPLSELRKRYFENLDSKHISTQCTHSPLSACTTCSTICSTGCCTTCGTWSYIYKACMGRIHFRQSNSTIGKTKIISTNTRLNNFLNDLNLPSRQSCRLWPSKSTEAVNPFLPQEPLALRQLLETLESPRTAPKKMDRFFFKWGIKLIVISKKESAIILFQIFTDPL